MFKTLSIPLRNLAQPLEPCFLKFLLMPNHQTQQDGLENLLPTALKTAVIQAMLALKQQGQQTSSCRLQLITPDYDLSNSSGAALALALTPYYLNPDCIYQHFIITGGLNGIEVTDSGHLLEKMASVVKLGYQTQPTLFLLPSIMFNEETKKLYQQLAEHNIAVRTVNTLIEAKHFITQANQS